MTFHVSEKHRIAPRQSKYSIAFETIDRAGNNGLFIFPYYGQEVNCIASDNDGWEHVSVTCSYPGRIAKRAPTWKIMSFVKKQFWDEEDAAFQIHAPKSEYVNHHPFCLHLWRPASGDFPRPPKKLVNGGIE